MTLCRTHQALAYRGRLCRPCYNAKERARFARFRAQRPHGATLLPPETGYLSAYAQARFWRWVPFGRPDACWLWTGPTRARGYGVFYIFPRHDGARAMLCAHRVLWVLTRGAIPAGHGVLHRCDTPQCVNPSHLFTGTHTDNMRDMFAKHRGRPRGRVPKVQS